MSTHRRTFLLLMLLMLVISGLASPMIQASPPHIAQDAHQGFLPQIQGGSYPAVMAAEAAAWPMAGANPQRTSWTPEEVRGSLSTEWYRPIAAYVNPKTQVIAANGLLYISTSKGLYAFNADNGDVAWVYPTELPLGNAPTIVGNILYVGGYDKTIHALEATPDIGSLPEREGYRVNERVLWRFQSGGGFEANPLVIDPNTSDGQVTDLNRAIVVAGSRDGKMYALGAADGGLRWTYETGGPILFSAAYRDQTIYFASNDAHAYALDGSGNLVWKSERLLGGGFYSWWPVVRGDYVIYGGSEDYSDDTSYTGVGVGYLANDLDNASLYSGLPEGALVGPVGQEPGVWAAGTATIDAHRTTEYYENQPSRRRYFVLNRFSGQEYTFDSDGDGNAEYAPIAWAWTHSGSRYPAVVGGDGVLYQHTSYIANPYIPRGGIAGWKVGTQYLSRVHEGNYGAVDEPIAYSAGGNLIYWSLCCDREAGAYDITMPYGSSGRYWRYWGYNLSSQAPGLANDCSTYGGSLGIYGSHGNVNPPIPYRGRVYQIASNALLALSPSGGSRQLPSVPAIGAQPADVTIDPSDVRQRLNAEIQKMVDAGHLRPGFFSNSLGEWQLNLPETERNHLTHYFHNPGETLYTLARALPHLSPELRSTARSYLQQEYDQYRGYAHIGWNQGAPREAYATPPEIQERMDGYGPKTDFYQDRNWDRIYRYYGLWKAAQVLGNAEEAFSEIVGSLPATDMDDEALASNPYAHNAYIAGYTGYLELQKLATGGESSAVRQELDRLLQLRADRFVTEIQFGSYDDFDYMGQLNVAGNFMFLVPELADYMRATIPGRVQEAMNAYYDVAPYWFVSKYDATIGEGALSLLYTYNALFQAKAMILQEPYGELVKVLDAPAFARGDLFYIHTLVSALEAAGAEPSGEQTPTATAVPTSAPTATPAAPVVPSADGPIIGDVTARTAESVERYAKFEVSFSVHTEASNPYFPYDANPPQGIDGGGITVDMLLLPPGESNWANARVQPSFYYQPVEEVGGGGSEALLPVDQAEWRARFTPDVVGQWQYRIRATDASGTATTPAKQFTVLNSTRKGFVRVSPSDPRFFEFSDGTPLVAPLVNLEEGSPFNSLAAIRTNIRSLGENGIRFVRWFPNSEGANYHVAPYAGDIKINWGFGAAAIRINEFDAATGRPFSFAPYYYTSQGIPAVPNARYRLTFRALVRGDQVLRAEVGTAGRLDVGSASGTFHEANGHGDACDYRRDGWNDYELIVTNWDDHMIIGMRGLYAVADGPAPYNTVKNGAIYINAIALQRDVTGNGDWGPNLLLRSQPNTHEYVDQRSAAMLDEIMTLSEQYGVYHKLPLFHKNDDVLNRFAPDGSIVTDWDSYNKPFYSQEGQAGRWYEQAYTRYFLARWSYSPALHSLELANENHLTPESYDAGLDLAEYVHSTSPRRVLMSNSFWGWWVEDFWTDPNRGQLIDYSDKHWYANPTGSSCGDDGSNCELISNAWTDSAAYVREAWRRFTEYADWFQYRKPIVRGEGGVAQQGTEPQHADIAADTAGIYYHKKVWAHVGSVGYTADGEWYPRLFTASGTGQFSAESQNAAQAYAAYDRFIAGEPLSNGRYQPIGTDLDGTGRIPLTNATHLRAWGSWDAEASRMLLWIDNAQQTWHNVVDQVPIGTASGTLTLQNLAPGDYVLEWWSTTSGRGVRTETRSVGADRTLGLHIDKLGEDIALKVRPTGAVDPTPPPGPTATPSPTPKPTATPDDGTMTFEVALSPGWNVVSAPLAPATTNLAEALASVQGYDGLVVQAYDATNPKDPWTQFSPSLPSYVNTLASFDEKMGLMIKVDQPTTWTVSGAPVSGTKIPLHKGWNLVGYPSLVTRPVPQAMANIPKSYKVSDWLKPSLAVDEFVPGRGYWIWVPQPCVWTVD